ncbi:MAG: DUF4290 domain-containing protein [Cyclobacteriaceae bacterium]|jgi:hypothetical protein|nr:DUF4290 domain-containing protein [Cytophagales bacterium]MCZ8328268.1 DUF4290 domain-containing protein [Cyclobacteriaceae bacterium]
MTAEYNTSRPDIILKEYGRNVQKLVEYIRTVPDKDKRTSLAATLIELIKFLNPSIKDQGEDPQRMWDDLYIMADFNLDLNNPYPVPTPETLAKRPEKMPYPQSTIRYKHYGKNIELLIQEALKKTDTEERQDAIIYLGKLMKTFFANWNKETLDDSVILRDLQTLSKGALTINIEQIREDNMFEKLYRDKKKQRPHGFQGGHHGQRHQGNRPFNKHKNKFRRRDNG